MFPGMLVLLALTAPPAAAQEIQEVRVIARDATGAPVPDLVRALVQAMNATGAHPTRSGEGAGACAAACVELTVWEEEGNRFRLEARHQQWWASTEVAIPAGARRFERARALAVEAQLLADRLLALTRPDPVTPAGAIRAARLPRTVGVKRSEAPAPRRAERPIPQAAAQAAPAPPEPSAAAGGLEATAERPPADTMAQEERPAAEVSSRAPPAGALAAAPRRPVIPRAGLGPAGVASDAVGGPTWAYLTAAGGVAAGLAAGAFGLAARNRHAALTGGGPALPVADAVRYRDQGTRYQTASIALGSAAAAALTVGITGLLLGKSGAADAGLAVGGAMMPGGGAGLGVSGSLP